MKIGQIVHRSKTYLVKQAPTILTGVGAVGVVATAVLTVKATTKASALLAEQHDENLDKFEIVKSCWRFYALPVATGIGTIACIFGANVLNRKQQAALTSAYIFLDQSFKEYRSKVKELYGEKDVRKAIVEDRQEEENLSPLGEKLIFYIEYYEHFFERTMLEVRDAEYALNRKMVVEGDVCVNDFLNLLGLPRTNIGSILGWSLDSNFDNYGCGWIDFDHDFIKLSDMECYVIDFITPPDPKYLPF